MNEHSFVKSIHRSLPPHIYRWKIHDTYTAGVPDAMYAGPSGILFVEYKWVNLPKRHTTNIKLGLSALQINWLNRFYLYGHSVMVAIGSDHGVLALSDKCWLKSFNNSQLKELSVTKDAFTALILESTHGGDKNDYPSDGLRPEPRSFTGQ